MKTMNIKSPFDVFVADTSKAILQIPEKELMKQDIIIKRSDNKNDFNKFIKKRRFDLIITCLDNDEFSGEEIIEAIRSSEKNHDTPVIIALAFPAENKLIENLYKAGANDIIFDRNNDNHFLSKIHLFQHLSVKLTSLNKENIKLNKENIDLKTINDKLNQNSKKDKEQIQKAHEELAREIAENVTSSLELNNKTRRLAGKIKELNISKENYKHITENVSSGIVIVNKNDHFLYANSRASEITGYSVSELSKFSMKDLIQPDSYNEVKGRLVSRIEGLNPENNQVTRLLAKNGELKIVEASGSKTKWEGETAALIVFNDITKRKRLSDLLNIQCNISYLSTIPTSQKESFEQIFETLFGFDWIDGGGIYLMNKERDGLDLVFHSRLSANFLQDIQFVPRESDRFKLIEKKKSTYVKTIQSPALSELLVEEGYKEILIIPLIYNDSIIGALNLVSKITSGLSENERRVFESIGSRITQLITLINTQGELQIKNQELQQTLKKIQEKQQLLIQKSKLESLGEMAAGVAHEINQPLGIIFLSLENILYKIGGKNVSQEYLDKKLNSISGNIKKIKDIIDHIRTFSRDQKSIIIERIDINGIIRKAIALINKQYIYHHISIKLNLKEDVGYTLGNSHKFEQVIYNLLSNAKFALEEKDSLPFDKSFKKEIVIETYCDDKKIIIDVKDNGIGIETANLDNIFNPFFTTKPEGEGTGLGLSIVYGIITEMKGSIHIKSKRMEYTLASIEFPKYKLKS